MEIATTRGAASKFPPVTRQVSRHRRLRGISPRLSDKATDLKVSGIHTCKRDELSKWAGVMPRRLGWPRWKGLSNFRAGILAPSSLKVVRLGQVSSGTSGLASFRSSRRPIPGSFSVLVEAGTWVALALFLGRTADRIPPSKPSFLFHQPAEEKKGWVPSPEAPRPIPSRRAKKKNRQRIRLPPGAPPLGQTFFRIIGKRGKKVIGR